MKNIFRQMIKAWGLFAIAFIVSYPCNIIICRYAANSLIWPGSLLLLMALFGAVLGIYTNRKERDALGGSGAEFLKNTGLQLLAVCILFLLALFKEKYLNFFSPAAYCDFLEGMLQNREQAVYLSYRTLPVLSGGYLLLLLPIWIFYNLAGLLRLKMQPARRIERY